MAESLERHVLTINGTATADAASGHRHADDDGAIELPAAHIVDAPWFARAAWRPIGRRFFTVAEVKR